MGPDADIGNSPILVSLPGGRRALFAGTKAGEVVALDPDKNGALLFKVTPSGPPVGSPGAAAERSCGAARPTRARCITGWARRHGRRQTRRQDGVGSSRLQARVAAVSRPRRGADRDPGRGIPGCGDGRLFAVSHRRQAILGVQYRAGIRYPNKVPARGGAIATSGAVVVDGMVYVGSGYAISSGALAAMCCWRLVWSSVVADG